MKFGKELANRIFPEWRFYYLEYDKLKEILKEKSDDKNNLAFSEEDEAAFVDMLEKEVLKIENFRNLKIDELHRKIQHYEDVFSRLEISKLNENAFTHFKQEFGNIGFELGALGKFTRLNFTGILKILKKHDKHTSYKLKPMFLLHFRNNPLYVQNMDLLLLRLSNLYNRLKLPLLPTSPLPPVNTPGSSETFVRKTTKYWVHPDNVTDVKLAILKHLPVIIYNGGGSNSLAKTPNTGSSGAQNLDFSISSVYLDNDPLELYLGRLEKTEGAEALRIRWYGKSHNPDFVFIERKIHKEDWTGEISVKNRFQLKEKHVKGYLQGTYTLEKALMKKRLLKQLEDASLDELSRLSSEVQETILKKKLLPMLRTKYNRMAFQYPGDPSVRISLDTELVMIKEKGILDYSWKRDDFTSTEYPYPEVPSDEIVRFPYAILEVKLQTETGMTPPKWITDLTSSQLVEEVPKFSKFVHGTAVLYEKEVQLFPFWISQMNVDIRHKISSSPISSSPPRSADSYSDFNAGTLTPLLVADTVKDDIRGTQKIHELKGKEKPELGKDHVLIDIVNRQGNHKEEERHPLLLRAKKLSGGSPPGQKAPSLVKGNRVQTTTGSLSSSIGGKKILIPVRVEPKVFFANERTFLSWLHFSIFLGGVSTALVGLGHQTAKISGYIFTVVSVIFSFYALYTYHWRARKIRQRDPGPYDDLVGPSVLVVVFLLAVIVNFIFTLYKQEEELAASLQSDLGWLYQAANYYQ